MKEKNMIARKNRNYIPIFYSSKNFEIGTSNTLDICSKVSIEIV